MATTTQIATVKLALRVTTTAFDTEIADLIDSAILDLGLAGVEVPAQTDKLVETAVKTYVKMNFGQADDYDRLKKSYDEQKAQLGTATGYTDWLDSEG